jgi:Nif-specific regulatory protein
MHLVMHDFSESTSNMTLEQQVEALERQRITASLRKNGHVHARAARELGITPRQFGYKVRKYGLE